MRQYKRLHKRPVGSFSKGRGRPLHLMVIISNKAENCRATKSGQRQERKVRQTKRVRQNQGRGEWKTKFGKRLRREGVNFAGESVSSRFVSLSKLGCHSEIHSDCVVEPVLITMWGLRPSYTCRLEVLYMF